MRLSFGNVGSVLSLKRAANKGAGNVESSALQHGLNYDKLVREHEVIKYLLKALAKNRRIRTLFAIRSEYVFGSLSSMFNIRTNGSDIDEYIEFYFLWGVNYIDDQDDYASISRRLNAEQHGLDLRDRLFEVCSIEHQTKANTFLLNLGGFLFEKFQDRSDVLEKLRRPHLSGGDLIDIYLDAAFEGYLVQTGASDRAVYDTVLYALANESKISGQACTLERLAGLAHYPKDHVLRVIG